MAGGRGEPGSKRPVPRLWEPIWVKCWTWGLAPGGETGRSGPCPSPCSCAPAPHWAPCFLGPLGFLLSLHVAGELAPAAHALLGTFLLCSREVCRGPEGDSQPPLRAAGKGEVRAEPRFLAPGQLQSGGAEILLRFPGLRVLKSAALLHRPSAALPLCCTGLCHSGTGRLPTAAADSCRFSHSLTFHCTLQPETWGTPSSPVALQPGRGLVQSHGISHLLRLFPRMSPTTFIQPFRNS